MAQKSVDEYINQFPQDVKERLLSIRRLIRQLAPEAKEKMGYGVPAFYLSEPLVYYAAFQKHIGLYPTSNGIEAFKDRLSRYKTSKGTIQFPHDQPLPLDLVSDIVQHRLGQIQKNQGEA